MGAYCGPVSGLGKTGIVQRTLPYIGGVESWAARQQDIRLLQLRPGQWAIKPCSEYDCVLRRHL